MPQIPTYQPRILPQSAPLPRLNPALGGAAGEGVASLGQAAQVAGEAVARAEQRIQARQDAVALAEAVTSYTEAAEAELHRLQTEDDFGKAETGARYAAGLRDRLRTMVGDFGGSPEAAARLNVRLEEARSGYSRRAAMITLETQRRKVAATVGGHLNRMADAAYNNPGTLPELFLSLDTAIDDMAAALPPEDELNYRTIGRQQIALSAINAYLDRGAVDDARTLIAQTPALDRLLTPEQRAGLNRRMTQFEQAKAEMELKARSRLVELRTILGRDPTPAERARYAGVAPPDGRQSAADKLRDYEAALGRPLDPGEKTRALGINAPGAPEAALSPQGKVIADRERFVGQYGADSPQVQAFDELVARPNDPPSLTDIGGQRKEFTRLSGDFVTIRDSFNRIAAAVQEPSPAGDLALMFNYMKMLDPGSVVRESEFAQVAATGSFGQRMQAAAERFLRGERLTDEQREDFRERSELLMRAQARSQLNLEQQFRAIAQRAGINPDDVVVDFVGPYRAAFPGAAEVRQGEPAAAPRPRFKVDLQGNIVGQ